ncbi:MAG: PAS domain S-box protein, partial [Pseudomonadota bacterium]|nr:PAS domain S-box protein [Pseudomonadota bacterium]
MTIAPLVESEGSSETSSVAVAALVFEHCHDLLLITDWSSRFVEVNPAWARLLGWEPKSLLGRSVYDLIHPDDQATVREAGLVLRETGASRQVLRIKTEAGGWRWLDGRSQVLSPERIMSVLRDVTDEREHLTQMHRQSVQNALLADKAGMFTWTMDAGENRFTRSQSFPPHMGVGGCEMALDAMAAFMHPDDQAAAVPVLTRAIRHGEPGAYDTRFLDENGGWTTFKVTFTTEDTGKGYYLVHGLSQDVSDLVNARDAAEAAAIEAQGVLENAPFASCILGPNFEYMSVSAAWKGLFGPYTDMTGKTFASRQTPAMRRRLHRALKRALAGEVYTRAEEEIERPDGKLILRWQARPWRTADGEIRGVIIYATDITDMVAARRAARANAKRLKLALEAADAAVFEIDYVNKTFWAGHRFARLAGRSFTYAESVKLWPTLHPDDRARLTAAYTAQDTRKPIPVEARLVGADGPRWARCQTRVQHDALGRPSKMTGLLQDIHAQKLQEIALAVAERQANIATEAKSNFLANISHEIRTPMNGVLGMMQLIKRDHLDAGEKALLDEALLSGRMLTEMLDDLLDFSKIETGQFELHPEALDPTAVLVGVASLLEPAASAKGLKMTAVAAPDLGLVKADPLRLRQALYNLMGNAVKFTPQGSIEARLARHTAEDGSERLRFEVQDTGIGVAEEFQATLFERFEQADGSATRKYGGSGLGLAITKRLAEMMGGAVGFSSVPGQGSTFWIEIDGAAVEPSTVAAAEAPDIGEFRVLLVEDNPTNRLVISKILEALGVNVDMAEDGAQGVELAASGKYDLVLMDIQMPGMDGIEATKRIRAMDGAVGSTPIVAVTANVLADQRTSYADAGMDGVV